MKKIEESTVTAGQELTVVAHGIGVNGEGVARADGLTVFVPGLLPGEEAVIKVEVKKRQYAVGRIIKRLSDAAERVEPLCPLFSRCGGCQLQHMDYQSQLAAKRQNVKDALQRIGGLGELDVLPVLGMKDPWYYRNKMQFPVAGGGKPVIGCFAKGSHHVIDTTTCYIQHETNNVIARTVRQWMNDCQVPAYQEKTHSGIVRHVVGRVGVHTGQIMVVIVTNGMELPHQDKLITALQAALPNLTTVVQNHNAQKTNVILGRKNTVLFGSGWIEEKLGDLTFRISAHSFFQVNTLQAERLYGKAAELAGLSGKERVVDAYCGTGTIGLFVSKHCRTVLGVEVVEAAIADAEENRLRNGIAAEKASFIAGDAAVVLPKLAKDGQTADVVILDPPRAGCHPDVLRAVQAFGPERIVYVSCNPATLARDLALLCEDKYAVKVVQPVDMFPSTMHVECVVLIERQKP